MAVSSIKDFWIHPNALTITLNYFGDPQLIQTSMLAGAVIMAYRKDVITYDAAHNFREWKLQAFPTQLNDTCAYYIHAELSRSGDTAMIIYSPAKRDIQGRTLLRVEKDENGRDVEVWNEATSTESYFIYLGTISASVDNDGATVERAWIDGFYTGTLDTDQQRMEDVAGEWKTIFNYNAVIEQIEPLKPFSKIKVIGEAIFQSIAQFVNGIVIGKRTITDVAASSDSGNESIVPDATLPTTGYVQKEIEALDDHFLIKDGEGPQFVAGPVTFEQSVTVEGDHAVGGNQTVQGTQTIGKEGANGLVDTEVVVQEIKGKQLLHGGFKTHGYFEQGDIIQGAQVTNDGIASFAKVKTPSMQVYELTLNRKTAVQGEFVFSDGEVVESVEFLGADTYLLIVRALYEGYITTFKKDDILYSNINIIGESAKTGKCWMYVTAVDGNKITAVHYPYEACPAGENINPVPYMTITRHGNINDETRQDLFIISSETSSLSMLRGVNAPIVRSEGLYGVVVGKLPATLLEYINKSGHEYVNGKDPYVYARGVIVQDLIMLDYQGMPIPTEAYRGEWQAKTKYYNKGNVYDSVTHQGSLWQCLAAETTEEPSDNSKDWRKKVSKGDDGNMPTIFTITSSLTSIHQDSRGKLNTNILDIWVNAVGAPSNFEIKDQATLDAYGLSVWFNIDEQEDVRTRLKLIIGGADSIEVEEGGAIIVAEDDDDDGGAYITLESESIDISSVQSKINIYLVRDADEDGFGVDENRMYIPVMRDGQRGRMLYPAGVYDSTKEYMIENNSAPFVKEGSTYYVLVWEGGSVNGIQPSTDTQGIYWRQFTYMNYLFAEFLMAKWAKFGGDNGGVFYDRYLFSQKGTNSAGEDSSFDQHMAGDSPMFDQNGALTYTFTPGLFLDFLTGEAKFGRITDSFTQIPSLYYEIHTGGPHNISVPKIFGDKGSKNFSIPTIFLSKDYEPLDGVHCSIAHELGFDMGWSEDTRNSSVFVCADKGFIGNFPADVSANNGWMVWNGYLTKFAFLAPGSMLKLRSVKNGQYGLVWHVENAEDFQIMNADMLLLKTIDRYSGYLDDNGYIDLSDSEYTHLYSNPNKKRIANNDWWFKDVGQTRTDFIVICSKVYSEYSEENYSGGVGNTFPAGQFRWLFDATGRTDGGLVRHIGRYDGGIPDFKYTDKK